MRLFNATTRKVTIAIVMVLTLAGCQSNGNSPQDPLMVRGINPSLAELNKGKTQFAEGNYGLAVNHFQRTVEIKADNSEGWLGLAASYDRIGRFDLSDRSYVQVLNLEGRKPKILNNMGYSQYLRGNNAEAMKLYNEALQIMPNDQVIIANMALIR